jgi:hypothetical protein
VSHASLLSRRAVLLAAPAAVLAVAGCGDSAVRREPASSPVRPDLKESRMFDLPFTIEHRYRPFALVTPGFTDVSQDSARELTGLTLAEGSPPAPFAAVEVDVAPGSDGVVVAGLATAGDEHLVAFYDRPGRQAGIEVRRGGDTHVLATTDEPVELPEAFTLGFVLCENQVTVLVDDGDGWEPVVTEREAISATVDMRVPTSLSAYRYAWGARPESGTVRAGAVRAGLFGMAGIRDQHLVQHADGTPYVEDGKAYFTATCAGLGLFQQAHWGVFTLDLEDPTRFEQVAQLFFRRDGLLLGDHAGQIVRDDQSDRWLVATSSWGDFSFDGVHVRHLETDVDVLHGVHVLETQPTPLPTEVSAWDPGLTRIDGRWYVSFVESPSQDPFDFHPALAAASQGAQWHNGLELVGAAIDLHQCEGPIIARVEDSWWLLASDGDNRVYPVFDLTMRRVGELDAPYETNIPHPQLLPHDGGYLLVTFDGTQYAEELLGYGSHGDVFVMRSKS